MNEPIGIFDSGIGGLTVAKELIRALPYEDIIYFGDTARVPYGSKSKDTIIRFSKEIVEFLLKKNVKLIVIACNTASSNALNSLKAKYREIPFVGVIKPAAERALLLARKTIGVIGTRATIESGIYSTILGKRFKITQKSCPLFVPLVEEGLTDEIFTKEIAKFYLDDLKKENIDTLILGCTHYPILKPIIRETMGEEVNLVDSAVETAKFVSKLLREKGKENFKRKPQYVFYFSDIANSMSETVERFLGRKVKIKKTILG